MSSDRVTKPWEWSVAPAIGGVEITIEREVINFVREVIPDGQMAGMMGHRPVESDESLRFALPTDQARQLLEDLSRALSDDSWWHELAPLGLKDWDHDAVPPAAVTPRRVPQ